MPLYYSLDKKIFSDDELRIHPDNRSFRYGEGLFETIRLHKGMIPLWDLHWNRLSESLPKLYFELPPHFNEAELKEEILRVAKRNQCLDAARVRITFFKGEGGIWERPSYPFHFLVQCWPLEKKEFSMNENGLDIGLFEAGRKSCDSFSNLKTNNYLLYALAAQYAKAEKLNECLVLNQHGRVCDATIANVFFSKDGIIHTPQLEEGCINGVMRRHVLEQLRNAGFPVKEGAYLPDEIAEADEIFLSNAMYGLRWVKKWGDRTYRFQQASTIFHRFISPLFP
ncbi:aminotransferase class IV [Lacibacter sediminis]|uniref:branched-chain-amino-acid transaminase n=1 Tax=Lacibacter sediminis TaxID=2760713 RepID=A0A7G5XIS8_9BACT|nr:aminotransferase class IV [Lacibacter sediminis]QNA45381.1 aminotransferase class IV [Lacibacter sediminis]